MKTALKPDHEINGLVELALDGNERAMTILLDKHRAQLQHLVSLRMDRRIQGRVDAADIVQDALIDAARRLSEFRDQNKMGFYVWLRWITSERLLNTHRRHLGSQIRDAKREVPIDRQEPDATPIALSQQLAGRLTSPTKVVARRELQMAIENVLGAILEGRDHGFVKVHTAKGTDKIVGATIVAENAGDMISEITLAMTLNGRIPRWKKLLRLTRQRSA